MYTSSVYKFYMPACVRYFPRASKKHGNHNLVLLSGGELKSVADQESLCARWFPLKDVIEKRLTTRCVVLVFFFV